MRYALLLLALMPLTASAEQAVARVSSGLTTLQVPLRSAMDLKRSGVVMQGFDYSCGAASIATLLTYGLDDPVDEVPILQSVMQSANDGERAQLTQKGLSLLDLQRIAEQRGHKARGFRIRADQLAKLKRPVIVYIKPRGYEHFAVFKGVQGDRVYLADPARGNVRMPLYQFFDMWADENGQGVVFVAERKDGQWPEASPLALTAAPGLQLEQISAREMSEIGKLYPLSIPNFILR
jgi:predicted double-glycine peptidase